MDATKANKIYQQVGDEQAIIDADFSPAY